MWLLETAAGQAANDLSSKINEGIENIKGRRDDTILEDAIRNQLLDRYGNEPFYNDLDSYLTRNKTIHYLVFFMRNPTPQQTVGRIEFVENNCDQLLSESPSCYAYSSQIQDILLYI